jgi:hypothetical protein
MGVPETVAVPTVTPAALTGRISASADEHTIKLIEVCLREHQHAPRSEFLAAAEAWKR